MLEQNVPPLDFHYQNTWSVWCWCVVDPLVFVQGPTLKYFFDTIEAEGRYRLMIRSVEPSDDGIYICTGQSESFNVRQEITVQVFGKISC